jgi:cytochrome b6-f complex iron-sulfur subunit
MNRRDFLKRIIESFFIFIGSCLALSVVYLYPARIRKRTPRFIPVIDEDDLPRTGVKGVEFTYESEGRKIHAKAFVVSSVEGLVVLSPVCSHLGCLVTWNSQKREFLCPCHGGRYAMTGAVIGGPPPAPLRRLPFEIRDGKLYVGIAV